MLFCLLTIARHTHSRLELPRRGKVLDCYQRAIHSFLWRATFVSLLSKSRRKFSSSVLKEVPSSNGLGPSNCFTRGPNAAIAVPVKITRSAAIWAYRGYCFTTKLRKGLY